MKMMPLPWARICRKVLKSSSASCGVSTAVGSSKIEYLGAAIQNLPCFDLLLQTYGEPLDDGAQIDVEVVELDESRSGGPGRGIGENAEPRCLQNREQDLSSTVKGGMSMKC